MSRTSTTRIVSRLALVLAVSVPAACSGDDDTAAVTTAPVATTADSTGPTTTSTTPATATTTSVTPTTPTTTPPTTASPPTTTTTTVGPTTSAPTTTTTSVTPTTPTTTPPTTTTTNPPTTTTEACRVAGVDDTPRLGDCGDTVTFIQQRLTVLGFPVAADGYFGPLTDAAVKDFQISRGLVPDGLVGPNTWAALVEGGIGD